MAEVECPPAPKMAWMEKEEITMLQGMWTEACESLINLLGARKEGSDSRSASSINDLINELKNIIETSQRDFDHFNYGKGHILCIVEMMCVYICRFYFLLGF